MHLPENWNDMDSYARQEYVRDPESPLQPKGVTARNTVSNIEIWCECRDRAGGEQAGHESAVGQ